jgi:hypothetical protein
MPGNDAELNHELGAPLSSPDLIRGSRRGWCWTSPRLLLLQQLQLLLLQLELLL